MLRSLSAADVEKTLRSLARTHSTRTVRLVHQVLANSIRRAERDDLVQRNVAALVDAPAGREGRPSNALNLVQAEALLMASVGSPLHAYIVLSLTAGLVLRKLGRCGGRRSISTVAWSWYSAPWAGNDTRTGSSQAHAGVPRTGHQRSQGSPCG